MKKTPGSTPAQRARYWTKHIEAARKYEAGVSAYLHDNNLEKNNYYQYFKRLRELHPEWEDLNKTKSGTKPSKQARSTEVPGKTGRRVFSKRYKARIVREYDLLSPEERSALLRREGLYAAHISKWRTAPAPKQDPNPLAAEVKALKARLDKAEKDLAVANKLLDLQKKISDILGINLPGQNGSK